MSEPKRSELTEYGKSLPGERASIGVDVMYVFVERASVGAGASIGAGASEAIDLGSYEGYRKVIAQVGGVAYIGAGCRWFTLSDAKAHWAGPEIGTRQAARLLERGILTFGVSHDPQPGSQLDQRYEEQVAAHARRQSTKTAGGAE